MIMLRFTTAIILIIILLQASSAPAAVAARVAVLPFEIYSDESAASLKELIAKDLSTHLAADRKLEVVDQARIRDMLAGKTSLTFNEATLRTISGNLDVPFLVLGSMTRIGETLSLDTYIFNVAGTPSFSKEFSEGKNLDSVTREMAAKVNAHILKMAPPPREEEAALPAEEPLPAAPAINPPEQPLQEEEVKEAEEEVVETAAGEAEEKKGAEAEKLTTPPEPEAVPREPYPVTASLQPDEGAAERPRRREPEKEAKEEPLSSPFASSKPVKITSESLEADNKKNTVTFKGNVVAKQGDMVILADTMTVDYEKEGGIKTVQAAGNVKMSQANRVATGTRIVFYNPEQKIVMTGNPKIWQGDNLISCEKITVLLEEDRIYFEGKVDSTIFPKTIREENEKDAPQVEAVPPDSAQPSSTAEGAGKPEPPPRQ